jgi:hypothetical protein
MKTTRAVAVIYENAETREAAVAFCDRLVQRAWAKSDLEVNWWSFEHLEEKASASAAADKTVEADMILFAAHPTGEMPFHVRALVESWLGRRKRREGVLVGLADPGTQTADKHVYLRAIARRAGLDYLTEVQQELSFAMPDSVESYARRADEVTSVLDEILHHAAPPRRMALEKPT